MQISTTASYCSSLQSTKALCPPHSFTVNLGQGKDTLNLHFNPRFNESIIVCNTYNSSSWGQEQRDSHMCFSPGADVKVRSKRAHGSPPAWSTPQGLSQAPLVLLTCFFPLQFTVTFQNNEFQVSLPDGHTLTFPNRLGHSHLHYLDIGGLHISSFKLD